MNDTRYTGFVMLDWSAGSDIESAYCQLQNYEGRCYGKFNGVFLDDTMSLDECYLAVTGKTKAEHATYMQDKAVEFDRAEKERLLRVPQDTDEMTKAFLEVVEAQYKDEVPQLVKMMVESLYGTPLAQDVLSVLKMLNNAADIEEVTTLLSTQGHSGTTHTIVLFVLNKLSSRADEIAYGSDPSYPRLLT